MATMALFAYGTLCLPEVMEKVCGRLLPAAEAILPGHRCRLVAGEIFPAVVADPGEDTPGLLYTGIDQPLLRRLDRYETDLYQRRRLPVRTLAGGTVTAWVYILAPGHTGLLSDEPWQPERFRRRHLAAYLADLA